MHRTLISAAEALAALARPEPDRPVVVDCRFDLARPEWGAQAWAEGHLPGAHYAHLDRDLSSPVRPDSGRHPLPARAVFSDTVRSWGIRPGRQVIACDQGNGMFAARLWWLLRAFGHPDVAVLDGGLAAWLAAGGTLSREPPPRLSTAHAAGAAASAADATSDWPGVLGAHEVLGGLESGALRLVDARAPDRFAGRNETIDPVAGHVPGAVNHPFASNLGADGRLLPRDELRRRWEATLAGRAPTELVLMCGSGVSACHDLLALEHAGFGGARLYAGSWSEWIRDPSRPIATGPDA